MKLKEFFIPTKWELIIVLIISLIAAFISTQSYMCFDCSPSQVWDGMMFNFVLSFILTFIVFYLVTALIKIDSLKPNKYKIIISLIPVIVYIINYWIGLIQRSHELSTFIWGTWIIWVFIKRTSIFLFNSFIISYFLISIIEYSVNKIKRFWVKTIVLMIVFEIILLLLLSFFVPIFYSAPKFNPEKIPINISAPGGGELFRELDNQWSQNFKDYSTKRSNMIQNLLLYLTPLNLIISLWIAKDTHQNNPNRQ